MSPSYPPFVYLPSFGLFSVLPSLVLSLSLSLSLALSLSLSLSLLKLCAWFASEADIFDRPARAALSDAGTFGVLQRSSELCGRK